MITAAIAILGIAATPLALDLRLEDAWAYRLEQSFVPLDSTNESEDEQRFTYEFRVLVTGVKTDEYDWESRSRLTGHRFGGEDLPGVHGQPDLRELLSVRRDGTRIVKINRYSDPKEYRLARLTWLGFAQSAADSAWKAEWPLVQNHWAPAASASFRRIGKAERLGRTCVLIEAEFAEDGADPLLAKGRMEVDEITGILMAAELKSGRATLPGGTEPQRLTVKLEVFELKLKKRA